VTSARSKESPRLSGRRGSRVAALVAAAVVAVLCPTTTAIAMPGWTAPVTITDPDEMGEFGAVAMDGGGNTMAVWYQRQPPSATDFLLRVAYRPAGGSFSAPRTLGAANQPGGGNIPPSSPQVAFDAAGNATVVWLQADGRRGGSARRLGGRRAGRLVRADRDALAAGTERVVPEPRGERSR
jgi:hypothetical protein